MLQLRSVAIASLASFFASRAFTQTHTPIITSSDCEGAGEVFTLHPASQSPGAHQTDGAPAQHFFGKPKYLTVSAQLHLEALAQAVGNVWTLSPTFRAEKSDTSRHLSEFYMLEAEMSFVDHLGQVMDLAEDMLRTLGQDLHQSRVATDFLSPLRHTNPDRLGADEIKRRWGGLLQESWPRVTYTEAISILGRSPEPFTQKAIWGEGLQSEHERYLARFVGGGEKPVFVTHYPRDIKAFYMRGEPSRLSTVYDQEAPPAATVESFDLLVPDFCEMAGGSMREHRLEQLVAAMEARGLATRPTEATTAEGAAGSVPGVGADQAFYGTLEWYVDLRRWGCPPHGGFGLGFDRLLAYLSGVQTVRDAVAFPRWFSRCDC